MLAEERSKFDYFSALYNEFVLHKDKARYYYLLFVIRRVCFIMLVIQGIEYSWIQVQFFIIGCVSEMSFLLFSRTMQNKDQHYHSIVNELLLIAIGYHMVLLTGYVVLPEQKYAIGTILLYIVWMMIFLNCSIIMVGFIKGYISSLKEKYKVLKRKKLIKKELRRAEVDKYKKWRRRKTKRL